MGQALDASKPASMPAMTASALRAMQHEWVCLLVQLCCNVLVDLCQLLHGVVVLCPGLMQLGGALFKVLGQERQVWACKCAQKSVC